MHILNRNFCNKTVSGTNDDVSVWKKSDTLDAQAKKLFDWSESFEECSLKVDFEEISCLGSTISKTIISIDSATSELSLDVPKADINCADLIGQD